MAASPAYPPISIATRAVELSVFRATARNDHEFTPEPDAADGSRGSYLQASDTEHNISAPGVDQMKTQESIGWVRRAGGCSTRPFSTEA